MRIKKLELVGFKSFKDRTVIQFDKGITGIVGPNGCGKSNIVDALVWVMGEMSAKHLRGSSMEDVIFAGAEGFAPVGLAEVSLTLENDGGPFPAKYMKHSEIMVTRRLHRSGESEYLINKEPARLKDIQEIFMDTGAGSKGFSIIEQGKIGEIITAKPEGRRVLIEEAAGITKFKARKKESQRKLQSTEQNLLRLQDIISEQKRQLDSLQRQAQKAERYRKLKNEIQEKELWLTSKNYLTIHEQTDEAQKTFDEAKEMEASNNSDLGQKETELETLRLEVTEREKQVEELQRSHQEKKEAVQRLENEIRELSFEIEQARRNKEMTGNILEQYTARKQALEKDLAGYQERLESVRTAKEAAEATYTEKKESFSKIQARINEVDEELTTKRREMLTVSQSETHLEARQTSLDDKIQGIQERLENSRTVHLELKEQKTEFETRRNKIYNDLEQERQLQLDIMRDVENFEENVQLLNNQVEEKHKEVENFKDQLNEVSSRLYGLENLHENFEGFQEGVKNVMLWQRQRAEQSPDGQVSSFQPMAEVVEVPQDYELAMEAALGQRLQLLLSDNSSNVLEAVEYLKGEKTGRSGFIPGDLAHLEEGEGRDDIKSEEGFDALLKEVVKVPADYQKQVTQFLNKVVIVDSIRTALSLRPRYEGYTFVTRDGDTLTADGVLTGGTAESAESGVLKRRREIKELSEKREEWAGKLSLAQASLKKLDAQAKKVNEELENSKKLHSEKEILIAGLKKDMERSENELANAEKALERQQAEVDKEEAQLQTIQDEMEELLEKITDIKERRVTLESEVEALDEEYKTSREGVGSLQEEVTQLQVDAASKKQEFEGLSHQVEMVQKSLDEVNGQLSQMSEESEKNTESLSVNQVEIEEKKVELERLIRESEESERMVAEARDQYEQQSAEARELEAFVAKTMQGINEQKARINEAQLKLEQLRMKEQYLIDQINERYMIDLSEVAHQYKDQEGDVQATEKEVSDLKSKLSRIGEVNLSAIEEYDDLSERYEFLSNQYQDLMDSKDQLRKVIDRINRICSRRFKETFEQVNERFTKVFPVLFGGGEAKLIIIEDPEKNEMGIDIVARPPGKKLQNVGLMSGGEKALTAVSLIFSIFLVKPSPYCLLDEVDAPLDDANVFRFNDLVKEMAKRSQIIIVTHNKHTMRVNNKLYGVTMENKGVSKMVSVALDEAERVVNA